MSTDQTKQAIFDVIESVESGTGPRAIAIFYRGGGVSIHATDYKSADAAVAVVLQALATQDLKAEGRRFYPVADAACKRFPNALSADLIEQSEGNVSSDDRLAFGYLRPSPVGPAPFECGGVLWLSHDTAAPIVPYGVYRADAQ